MRRGATEEILRVLNAGQLFEGTNLFGFVWPAATEFSVEPVEALGSQLSIAVNELGSIKRVE